MKTPRIRHMVSIHVQGCWSPHNPTSLHWSIELYHVSYGILYDMTEVDGALYVSIFVVHHTWYDALYDISWCRCLFLGQGGIGTFGIGRAGREEAEGRGCIQEEWPLEGAGMVFLCVL